MSTFKIKDGVELPPPRKMPASARARKYPFDTMDIGDRFFVPKTTTRKFSTYAGVQGRKLGRKFSTLGLTMRQDLQTGEWEPCRDGMPGAVQGVAVTRIK